MKLYFCHVSRSSRIIFHCLLFLEERFAESIEPFCPELRLFFPCGWSSSGSYPWSALLRFPFLDCFLRSASCALFFFTLINVLQRSAILPKISSTIIAQYHIYIITPIWILIVLYFYVLGKHNMYLFVEFCDKISRNRENKWFLEEVISWKEMNCAGAAAAKNIRNAICRLKKR